MDWWKNKSLMHVWKWPIKVLSLVHRSMIVIFAIHYVEIVLKSLFYLLYDVALRCIRVNWFSPLPVILVSLIKETVISNSIAWDFVNVFHLISVLMHSASLIEELFILCVIKFIILWVCNVCPIIPSWNCSWPRHISSVK